ncbi:MAG: cobyrinate a,c-diamide synthase [Pseudomonadota bacterium]
MATPLYACCLAAPRSGEGKTMVSMCLMRLLTLRGMTVQAFKCGPDYIDPTFHSQATGRPSYNVDTWMMGADGVRDLWARQVLGDDHADVKKTLETVNKGDTSHKVNTPDGVDAVDAVICEGVMGLFDGKALAQDTCLNHQNSRPFPIVGSTLDCARVLGLPIILVVNARGMATSIAALVHGFVDMAKRYNTDIVGIIANNVGSPRHTDMLRTALRLAHLPPLLGAIPRCADWSLPERQLGLVPQEELSNSANLAWLDAMVAAMEPHIDVEALLAAICIERPQGKVKNAVSSQNISDTTSRKVMALARDTAFCFYYDANLSALRAQGWELVEFSPLHDAHLPHACTALYLGGGYPEEFAEEIAANTSMRQSIQAFAKQGGLVYAECGGYMALAKTLLDTDGVAHEMYGLINATARMGSRLKSLGYREFILQAHTPFAQAGSTIRGHEFHWSDMEHHEEYAPLYSYEGKGVGVAQGNIVAGYGHLYWAHLPKNELNQYDDLCPKHGKVVIFNGPSSAGKSTLVALVQKKLHTLDFPTLSLSMDNFLKATSCGHENAREAMNHDDAVVQSLHGAVSAAAHAGTSVLVDHVLGEDDAWRDDIIQRLHFTPFFVQVYCHLPELERRELQRHDRNPDLEHVRRQHAHIHTDLPQSFCVDTSDASPEVCADAIVQALLPYFSHRCEFSHE